MSAIRKQPALPVPPVSADILQQQLEETQRAMQDLVYVISHDLGAPLRAVTGFSAIIQEKYAHVLDDKGRSYLNFISQGGERAQKMLTGLLHYSRVMTQAKPFSFVALSDVMEVVRCDLDAAIIDMHADLHCGLLPVIWGDEEQMRQLFAILIGNALAYRRPGVTPAIDVTAQEIGDCWRIDIRDNGRGIPPAQMEKAFDIFTRLCGDDAPPGIGMGLAVARRIVERHGGAIGILPGGDAGITVVLTLPKGHGESAP
ncbi:MAG: hypothetical protein KGI37_07875 [Alphaproteobacteria bacterium]|nr:hypothetical protein [Alphaproteobacteria bacterium]